MKEQRGGLPRRGTLAAFVLGMAVCTVTPTLVLAQEESADREPSSTAGVVNLNTATQGDLERLPGVGPAKASAILALRERRGRFRRIEEVMLVRGIGRATFRRLRPMLTLEGETTLAASQRSEN